MRTYSKILLLTLISFCSFSSFAHYDINSQCNVSFNGDMHFSQDTGLSVKDESGRTIVINTDHSVWVDGKAVVLSANEQRLVSQYYVAIESGIPMAIDIAIDAIDLAQTTIGELLVGLIGQNSDLNEDAKRLFTDLRNEITQKQQNSTTFSLEGDNISFGGWSSNTWERQLEERVEDLVAKATGALVMSIGSDLLFGDEAAKQRFARLETLGDEISQQVEVNAEKLEGKADTLCGQILAANTAEDALGESNAVFRNLNIIRVQ